MADPFGVNGGGHAGDPFGIGGSAKPKQHHHSLAGQFVDDLKNAAVNLPGGLYHTAGGLVHHPVKTVETIARGTAEDIRHPLRHPGYTALDLLGIADAGIGLAGRAAEVGRAATAGESVARAAIRGAKPEARVVRLANGETVDAGTYSRAASSRTVQKGLDRLREKYPDVKFGLRNQHERAGFNRSQNERIKNALVNAPAHQIVRQAKQLKLNKSARLSIRIVAEGVPLQARIADTEKFLAESSGRAQKLLQNHLTLLKRASKYVHDVETPDGVVPRFRPEHEDLAHFYERVKKVANKREADLIESGALRESTAEARKSAPGQIITQGSRENPNGTQLQLGFDPDLAPEVFHNEDGFYVSYRNAKNPKSLGGVPQIGVKNQIGVPRNLSELNHEFTGTSLHTGNVHPDTVGQVAADSMRANRLLTLWRQRKDLQRLAKDAPTNEKYDIPIRPIWLKNKRWPAEIRAYIDKLDQGLEPEADLHGLDRFRKFVFPDKAELPNVKGVKWIDRRLLDRQNLPSPMVGLGSSAPVKVMDAINQAERAAILFKPAYVLPNLGSNVAINIVQQGFAAIPNLTRASTLDHILPVDDVVKIDAGMQNGVVASLGNEGLAKGAVSKIQHGLGALVDRIPRRASFYYEAKRFGHDTPEKIHDLLNNPEKQDELVRVLREANGEIIDYERLGPIERDLVRRLVFLYPWVKGSTVYAGRFLREHPVKAAVAGQVGAQQSERTNSELGNLPSYLEGLFKVGGSQSTPEIVNPASLSPFGTPAQLTKALAGIFEKNPGEAYTLAQFLVPALQAESRGASTNKGSAAGNFLSGLYASLPPVLLEQRLAHPNNQNKIYPYNRTEAILQYLLGSPSPHRLNKAKANKAGFAEQNPR